MEFRHILTAIFVACIWGFNFVTVKTGLGEMPPFLFVAVRYFCACFPLILFIKKPPVSNWIILGIGSTLGIAKFALMFLGIYLGVSAGIASLLLQTQAFFTIIFSILIFKSRITFQQILGMVIAFSGIFLIGVESHGTASLAGFFLLIISAFFWAISNIITKQAGTIDMFPLVIWTSLIPPLPMLGLSFTFEGTDVLAQTWAHLTWGGIISALYTAWVATWLGATLWSKLLSWYSPAVVAPYSLLIPVFAIVFCWIFLGESMSLLAIFASSLILLGLLINQWPRAANLDKILRTNILKKAAA